MRGSDTLVYAGDRLGEPLVALTFDDGPGDWTETILGRLESHGARATFFALGSSIEGREDVLRRTAASGHDPGGRIEEVAGAGMLPAWLAWASLVFALGLLIFPIGWAVLIFGVPLWTVVVSVLLWRRASASETTAAVIPV